jgi:hypothetical protein
MPTETVPNLLNAVAILLSCLSNMSVWCLSEGMTVHIAVLATSSFTVPLACLQRTRLLRSSVFDLSFFLLCLPSSCSVKRATEQAALVSFSEDVYTKTVKVKLSHITSHGDSETVRNVGLPSLLWHWAQLGLQCCQLYALEHYPKENAWCPFLSEAEWVPWLLNGDRRIRSLENIQGHTGRSEHNNNNNNNLTRLPLPLFLPSQCYYVWSAWKRNTDCDEQVVLAETNYVSVSCVSRDVARHAHLRWV